MTDKELAQYIGIKIKEYRLANGYTQKELAKKIGMGDTTIANYEKGFRSPKKDTMFALASAFNVSIDDLFPPIKSETRELPSVEHPNLPSSVSRLNSELNADNHAQWIIYGNELLEEQNTIQEEAVTYRPSPQRDERFTTLTDQYRRLNPSRKETIRDKVQEEIKEQNIVRLEDIRKRNDFLSHSDSSEVEEIGLYGEVSAGTGLWLSDETIETILYPKPVPGHDIALRVKGNSMEPLFQDGEIVFVRRTQSVNSGQIIIIIVNNEAYIKKLYKRHDEVRLISLNSDYDDIILTEYDQIEVVGIVVL